jgi:hypothetical protein
VTQQTLVFKEYTANTMSVLPVFAVFIGLTIWIVSAGVEKGIEKWSKILMPVLFVMMMVIIVRSLTLDGAEKGLKYYLSPDFSKIDGKVVLMALGQAFFSLSVGWGLMITYGSYMPKSQNIVTNGLWVASADTLVAILAGFMVFPAVFAFGMDPGEDGHQRVGRRHPQSVGHDVLRLRHVGAVSNHQPPAHAQREKCLTQCHQHYLAINFTEIWAQIIFQSFLRAIQGKASNDDDHHHHKQHRH